MMSKYVLLKNDGNVEVKELEEKLELETMYDWIGCDFIEIGQSIINDKMDCSVKLVFDEEFLLKNEPQVNKIASLLFGYGILHDEVLCGNVLIAKDVLNEEGEPELSGFNDGEIKKLESIIEIVRNIASIMIFKVHEPKVEVYAW
jgi:hypothetical protein